MESHVKAKHPIIYADLGKGKAAIQDSKRKSEDAIGKLLTLPMSSVSSVHSWEGRLKMIWWDRPHRLQLCKRNHPSSKLSLKIIQPSLAFRLSTQNFPILKDIALDIISVPVTEVTVERLFSHLDFVVDEHCSTMAGSIVEDIMFLRLNKKFLN